jgi:hypothetical protein
MEDSRQMMPDLFFKNNGEIDLLTGTIAPNQFNQIVRRDSQLSDRNGSKLSIISISINMKKIHNQDSQLFLENALIEVKYFAILIVFVEFLNLDFGY